MSNMSTAAVLAKSLDAKSLGTTSLDLSVAAA